jgi:hypothetical protein
MQFTCTCIYFFLFMNIKNISSSDLLFKAQGVLGFSYFSWVFPLQLGWSFALTRREGLCVSVILLAMYARA